MTTIRDWHVKIISVKPCKAIPFLVSYCCQIPTILQGVDAWMAPSANGDRTFLFIATLLSAELGVMYLEVLSAAAEM